LTCACGCRKDAIGKEASELLEIVPMQIGVIKHARKDYCCRDCDTAPVTADKPAQLIENACPAQVFWRCAPPKKIRRRFTASSFRKSAGPPRHHSWAAEPADLCKVAWIAGEKAIAGHRTKYIG